MEGDDVSDGDVNHKRGGSDENSDENNNGSNSKFANSNDGQSKPKRQMKTPFQLETLEKAYAMETYPTEKMRLELSEKLGLTDRQLQMWFCHRRLKDKKDLAPKKLSRNAVEPSPEPPAEDLGLEPESGNDSGSRSGSGSSPFTPSEFRSVVPRTGYYESPQAVLELRAIACVEGQLGEPLREDGPILGVEFDPLPPDAFGAHIAVTEQKRPTLGYDSQMYERHDVRTNKAMARTFHEYQFPPKQPSIRSDAFGQYSQHQLHDPMEGPARNPSFVHGDEQIPRIHATHGSHVCLPSQPDKEVITYPSPPQENDVIPQRESYTKLDSAGTITHYTDHQIADPESSYAVSDVQIFHDNAMRIERKRKSGDARSARDVEAHDMRTRKELEKEDNLRRKSEERIRKEIERQDRERKKEEERLMRERQREEERTKREQKREIERREKYLLKENLKAEKMRQKEELRKEKEAERRKAALEKATARRLAKESMELIEDEQLELMELAASNKGFPSIIHLDLETLQNLESFRDSLSVFPPKSVRVKNPFAVQPWINSEENVGNLLMVWRFFIAFADVLQLWPFTLDEFVQAFHDYDSRLLGEIHIALLKVIIKDIEDVSRTPTGLGMNQIGTTNSGGGHPEIVEGAYSWGFDIRNWHKHLNQLTWPEIFRQLALSAGYGPQLKKGSLTWSCANDKDESQGKGIEDIISTLRNGSAAENAVAKMRHRGLLAPRKSRHRLTPGTVKFAAFHVLSLEGSKGLNVLELAEKIQKSGLRDLSTSKTPEASISVALTRDTKLFERVAPSTYRVRSTFRKDPVHAESILSEARKKIQIFENGFVAGEGADDVEREEDSDSDEVDEDPEVDDLVNPARAKRTSEHSAVFTSNGNENLGHNVELIQDEFQKDLPCFPESVSRNADSPVAVVGQAAASEDLNAENVEENTEIDESKCGESWVQGLSEGEYSDLSVEERLNALVVLVGMANEGNSIRVVLEDRLEAANALKKQMWAEAQIDKVRPKDDYLSKSDFPSINGNTVETQFTCPAVEGNQSPLLDMNIDNNNGALSLTPENQKATPAAQSLYFQPWLIQDPCTSQDNPQAQLSVQYSKRSRSQLKSYISHIAEEMYVYRSLPLGQDRRRNRYWQFVACASCNDPGAGRIFVEYLNGKWRLIDSEEAFDALLNSLDSRGIRESHLRIMLQKIENSFKENVRKNTHVKVGSTGETSIKNEADETDSSPDHHTGFDSPSSTLCGLNSDTSETSLSFKIELGKSESEKKAALKRYQDFQKWMWRECYKSSILSAMKNGKKRCKPQVDICDTCLNPYFFEDSHCNCCHQPFPSNSAFNFSKHAFQCGDELSKDICILDSSLPLQTRLLKALMAYIEACVPPKAFNSIWTEDIRRRWGLRLSKSNSVEELLQIFTLFERALQRNYVSSNFSTTEELLGSSSLSQSAGDASADPESVALLPWVPQTTPAVCLRLFEFDASISYIPVEKPESFPEKEAREYIKLPSRNSPFKSGRVVEPSDLDHDEFMKVKSADMKIVRSGNKRGRGTHDKGRGKKLSKGMHHSEQDTRRHTVKVTENLSQRLKQQQGRGSQGKGGGRGRRTVRKRRVEKRAVDDMLSPRDTTSHSSKIGREPLRNMYEEWVDDENESPMTPIHIGPSADVISNSTEDVESDDNVEAAVESDDNGQAVEYDQGNWEIGFNGNPSNRYSRDLVVGMSDEDMEASEDDNNIIEEDDDDDDDDDDSVADIMSEDSDGVANGAVNVQGSGSSDSEQSYD